MNRVAVIVLNWNGIKDTLSCVESLLGQTYTNFTIIVVDNGSKEESVSKLKQLGKLHEEIIFLYNNRNLGFSGGVNTGIVWALEHEYAYIALINNDAVTKNDWLGTLVSSMETNSKTGIVTGLLLNDNGLEVDSTGEQYSIWGLPFPRERGENKDSASRSGFVFGATGGASLYRATMLRDIGTFDEDFFAYYEDVDISFRAQLTGWKVYYEENAMAYHKKGATSGKLPGFTVHQAFKNLPLLLLKNVPARLFFRIAIRFYFAYAVMLVKAILRGDGRAALAGAWKAATLTPKKLRERQIVQNKKTVGNSYIQSLLWPHFPPRNN